MSGSPNHPPVPVKAIVTGFSSGSSDGISKVLLKSSRVVGENLIVIVQLADGLKDVPLQLSDTMLNGDDGSVTVSILKDRVPSFITVTVLSEFESIFTLPKGIVVGVTVMSGA